MRIFITAIMIIINFILQSTWLHAITIRSVLPNTTVILIVSYALLRGKKEGALVGLCVGLLQDIFFGVTMGYFGILGAVTGYLAGRSNENFYRENYLMPMALCSIGVFLYETIIYITRFLFHGELNYLYILGRFIVPEMVYTAIFTIVIYRILFFVNEWLELKEKYKYRLF